MQTLGKLSQYWHVLEIDNGVWVFLAGYRLGDDQSLQSAKRSNVEIFMYYYYFPFNITCVTATQRGTATAIVSISQR